MSLSLNAIKAFYSTECDEEVFLLLTLSGANIAAPIRLCTGFDRRLNANDLDKNVFGNVIKSEDEIIYGTVSRGDEFIFMPMDIPLPGDEEGANQAVQITLHNVTRLLTPTLRSVNGVPNVLIEVVLASALNTVEAVVSGLVMSGYKYDQGTVSGSLVAATQSGEQFPQHSLTPAYFPGLF